MGHVVGSGELLHKQVIEVMSEALDLSSQGLRYNEG